MSRSLRWALEDAHIPVLLAVLAQVTGDDLWLREPYRPTSSPGLSDHPDGGLPEQVRSQIRDAAAQILSRPDLPGLTQVPDEERLRQIMSACTGEEVPLEYVPMMREEMGWTPRFHPEQLRALPGRQDHSVVIIGAGPSGLCLAIQLRLAGVEVTVLEKNTDLGGTWFENRYPGCGVDTPSNWYSYSFFPGTWSRAYAKRDEIHAYLRRAAAHFGVLDCIRFNHRVERAEFDEEAADWVVTTTTADGTRHTVRGRFLVSAVGQLNRPAVPTVTGAESFAGAQFHSANWPAELDLEGQQVAVVGTGASAMQLVPAIADQVGQLSIFQRTPQWVAPHPEYSQRVTERMAYLMEQVPFYAAWHRMRQVWTFGDKVFDALVIDPHWEHPDRSINAVNDTQRKFLSRYAKLKLLGYPDLLAKALPDYPPFGKRMLLDNGWFDTLKRPHVELVTDSIERITPGGVVDSAGTEHPADVLVYATGFHSWNPLAQISITGRQGRQLQHQWGRADARAYLGITEPGFPNLFFLYGPNTNLGHGGSLVFINECQVRYILDLLGQLIARDARQVECRPEVHEDYNRRIDEALETMIWTHPGMRTWYRNDQGRVVTNSPWRILEHWRLTQAADLGDFHVDGPAAQPLRR